MHCKIPVQTCDMSEQILFHTEQLVSETKRVNYHSKVWVCVCVRACMGLCVCVCLCLYIYTTSWAQKVKTCLAKGCCPTGLGQYIRFHMRCKFKSMTFPLSRKLPALLVPSTIRLSQCWQKEDMMLRGQGTRRQGQEAPWQKGQG